MSSATSLEGLKGCKTKITGRDCSFSTCTHKREDGKDMPLSSSGKSRSVSQKDTTSQFDNNPRRGRYVRERGIVRTSPTSVKKAREASLSVRGAKIFNLLPQSLRSFNSDKVDGFKRRLDNYLQTVPDQPLIQGRRRGAETNSLIHQIPWATRQNIMG